MNDIFDRFDGVQQWYGKLATWIWGFWWARGSGLYNKEVGLKAHSLPVVAVSKILHQAPMYFNFINSLVLIVAHAVNITSQ